MEKKEPNLRCEKAVPVYNNFDYTQIIGIAQVRIVKGYLYADLYLYGFAFFGYYPAVGFQIKGSKRNVFAIGLSPTKNEDVEIKALEI